jgi:hypothetical protein
MMSLTAATVLFLSCPAVLEEKLPPTMEIRAVEGGVEIVVGRLKITGKSFRLDQARQTLSVQGDPARLIIQGAPGFKEDTTSCRGPRIFIDLKDGSIRIDDGAQEMQPIPNPKK